MRHASIHPPETYTLDDHFSDVKAFVNKSTVRRFGDLSIGKELLSKFIGDGRPATHYHQTCSIFKETINLSAEDQELAKLSYFYNRAIDSGRHFDLSIYGET